MQKKNIFLFFIFFFFYQSTLASVKNKNYCDSIIKVGIKLLYKKDHIGSLELLYEANQLAEKNNWYKQFFFAQNNIGNNYYMLLNYGEALTYFVKSYQIASLHLDDASKMTALNNIAVLYGKEEKYEKASIHFVKAFNLAKKHNDSVKMGIYRVNMGILANKTNELKQARLLLNQSLNYSKTEDFKIPAKVALCDNSLLSGNIKEARLKAKKLLLSLKKETKNTDRIDLCLIIVKSYLQNNELTPALQWANSTFDELPDLEIKRELYLLLSEIYFKLKSYNIAFNYKDSIIAADTKLNTIKNSKLYESSEVKFKIQNFKEKINEKENRLKSERKLFHSILIGFILAVIILILILRNYLIKSKQKQLLAKGEQELTTFKLEKEIVENALLIEKEKTIILEKERLQNEIQLRNQRILSRSVYSARKNKLLQDLIASFTSIPNFKNNNLLAKKIEELNQHIKMDEDWDNYVRHFEEVNQGFIKRLTAKHQNLTTTDIRYISYLYMNLDTKEIANMLNITPVACRKRKERIEKKINLPNNQSLNSYLLNI